MTTTTNAHSGTTELAASYARALRERTRTRPAWWWSSFKGVIAMSSGAWFRDGRAYIFDEPRSARGPFNVDPRALATPDTIGVACQCEPGGMTTCEGCLELTPQPVGVADSRAPSLHVLCPRCRHGMVNASASVTAGPHT